MSLALSTPSPSPRGNLLANISYDGTVTMLSLANPPAPPRRDHADGDRPQIAASACTMGYLAFSVPALIAGMCEHADDTMDADDTMEMRQQVVRAHISACVPRKLIGVSELWRPRRPSRSVRPNGERGK
jgi:hypothetical protein